MGFDSVSGGYTYSMGEMENTRGAADNPDDDIGKFFSRPVQLGSYIWTVDTPFYNFFNPLKDWIENPRVSNRLSNYRNMRGHLNVKFLINGTPFNRGLMLVHAQPLALRDTFSRTRALVQQDCIAGSQMPHIYLNPTTSQGGNLKLPFFWQFNSLNLVTGQANDTWRIIMRDIAPLGNSQGNSTVTIQVLAWMEDIVLSSPTSHNADGIIPQGGEVDEYGDRPISTAASAVERASGALINAPYIGSLARATNVAASLTKDVANAFGYSRPVNIEKIGHTEIKMAGSMANYNLPDSAAKLSLDAKKEVTIDPTTTGISGVDEMHIATIAQRESYVTTFSWSETQTPGTPLLYAAVTPSQFKDYLGGGATVPEKHMTPSCWACVPFEYWRGSMKFRFKVIGSSFHKGRLRISYDPVFSQTFDDFNVVHNHVFDIAETKDFCVKIGWSSEQTYLKTNDLSTENFSLTEIVTQNETNNGTIKVEVFTELASSSFSGTDRTIQILMFTSMCDDFEVASPRSALLHNMTYNDPNTIFPEGGVLPQGGDLEDHTPMPDIPVCDTTDTTLGGGTSPTIELNDICFGEAVVSWKQCIQRYCMHNAFKTVDVAVNTNVGLSKHWRPDFPIYRGSDPNGVHRTLEGDRYNYTFTTILNWVTPAYTGWRGGLRWKYIQPCNSSVTSNLIQVVRTPVNQGWQDFNYSIANSASPSATSDYWRQNYSNSWQGGTLTSAPFQPVISVEVPYYNANRFSSARRKDMMLPLTEFRSHTINVASQSVNDPILISYVAAADDFMLFFFNSVPVCWIVPSDPTPAA